MKVVLFVHSLISDWNHGNAHFLRGIVAELQHRGHEVGVFEPRDAWSVQNLVRSRGQAAIDDFAERFPHLRSTRYDPDTLDLHDVLDGADVVIVHEWNEPELIARVGAHRQTANYLLLFHDTHHRAVTQPEEIARFDLTAYDGVLAFGDVIRDIYVSRRIVRRGWTWHEAADTRVFKPVDASPTRDVVWIGNWGDEERTQELQEFLLGPAQTLQLSGTTHGVRYPPQAEELVAAAGLEHRRWIANYRVPEVFARHRVTLHIPRRPYARRMTGVPTIRVFEALACGIPLICAAWDDTEHLFRPGRDYLVASSGVEMQQQLKLVLNDPEVAQQLATAGLETIRSRHTCAHRVDELLAIVGEAS